MYLKVTPFLKKKKKKAEPSKNGGEWKKMSHGGESRENERRQKSMGR